MKRYRTEERLALALATARGTAVNVSAITGIPVPEILALNYPVDDCRDARALLVLAMRSVPFSWTEIAYATGRTSHTSPMRLALEVNWPRINQRCGVVHPCRLVAREGVEPPVIEEPTADVPPWVFSRYEWVKFCRREYEFPEVQIAHPPHGARWVTE